MNFTCPHCDRDTTLTVLNYSDHTSFLTIKNAEGGRGLTTRWIVCPNKECTKISLIATLSIAGLDSSNNWVLQKQLLQWRLLPQSAAKIYPDYIPAQIRQDYIEATAIVKSSPRASATLSRRCLQGMIRDFWGISKKTLYAEIEAIEEYVDAMAWQAIDAVRIVGNISAHMQDDVNHVIEVEPEEALLLINLIELLMKEWYINRHERSIQLQKLAELGGKMEDAKKK